MPRTIQISCQPEKTDALLAEIRQLDELIGVQVYRGASVQPPGDIIAASMTTEPLHALMRTLRQHGAGQAGGPTIITSEVASVVFPPLQDPIQQDSSEATWEEMDLTLGKESEATANSLLVMALAGGLAAAALMNNVLHILIAAMLIAPGFEPLARIGLGIGAGGGGVRRGLRSTVKSYIAMILGGLVIGLVLPPLGVPVPEGKASAYLPKGVLLEFALTFTATSVLSSLFGALGGAVLIAARRSVLTGGAMVALALIPSAAAMGLGMAAWDGSLFTKALLRWLADVAFVVGGAAGVFGWKRWHTHKRPMLV
jgi:hypothetical protein